MVSRPATAMASQELSARAMISTASCRQANGLSRRRQLMQHVARGRAQIERQVAVGEAAPLLSIQIPQRVHWTVVGIPEFIPTGGQAQGRGIKTGGAPLVGVAPHAAVEVHIPNAQQQPCARMSSSRAR